MMTDKKKWLMTDAEYNSLIEAAARALSTVLPPRPAIYGVPRGGIPVAHTLAGLLSGRVVYRAAHADAIVDDIVSTGTTKKRYAVHHPDTPFFSLVKQQDLADEGFDWVVFPWEMDGDQDTSADDIVIRLLQYIGEDPEREGLLETPRRVLRAWKEWTSGYQIDVPSLLKTFTDGAKNGKGELVIVNNLPVQSVCEHHMAPFHGIAHVGYIPAGKIVGLSKLGRVVDAFSRRLQVQERLTQQVADTIQTVLRPAGVGVIIRATHTCMSSRGLRVHGSTTTTSAMRGVFMDEQPTRQEFMDLCRSAEYASTR